MSKKWNQGRIEQNPFPMQRCRAEHRVEIRAAVERVFERACLGTSPGWLSDETMAISYPDDTREERYATCAETESGAARKPRPRSNTNVVILFIMYLLLFSEETVV